MSNWMNTFSAALLPLEIISSARYRRLLTQTNSSYAMKSSLCDWHRLQNLRKWQDVTRSIFHGLLL